jgi:hypothetical protein
MPPARAAHLEAGQARDLCAADLSGESAFLDSAIQAVGALSYSPHVVRRIGLSVRRIALIISARYAEINVHLATA